MFVLVVGAGKVGLNAARSLTHMGHEVVVIEQRRMRHDLLLPELAERLRLGDGTEIHVLEKAGIARADMVVAVTGDDEDNVIISEIAKLKYDVPKVVARVNNPRNQASFDLLGVDSSVCAATMLISMIQHELPVHKYVSLLRFKREGAELVELEVSEESPFANQAVSDIQLPEGVLLIAIMRPGTWLLAHGSEVLLPDDHVLCLLDPRKEKELIHVFLPSERPEDVQAEASIEMLTD